MASPPQQATPSAPPVTGRPPAATAGIAITLAATLCFSVKAVLIKLAYAGGGGVDAVPDAITIQAGRMAAALPCFVAVALWTAGRDRARGRGPAPREWLGVAALGVLGYYLAALLDTQGLAYVSAATERVLLFVYPTLVVLLGALFLKEPVRRPMAFALAVTYAGVALAVGPGGIGGPERARGVTLVLAAAACFAVFTVVGGGMIRRVGATRFTAWTMSAAGVATAVHYGIARGLGSGPGLAALPPRVLVLCVAMGLVSTVAPAFLMAEGIRRIGAGRAAVIGTVGPVATIALDHLLLGEAVSGPQAAGAALVVAGVLAAGRTRGR